MIAFWWSVVWYLKKAGKVVQEWKAEARNVVRLRKIERGWRISQTVVPSDVLSPVSREGQ